MLPLTRDDFETWHLVCLYFFYATPFNKHHEALITLKPLVLTKSKKIITIYDCYRLLTSVDEGISRKGKMTPCFFFPLRVRFRPVLETGFLQASTLITLGFKVFSLFSRQRRPGNTACVVLGAERKQWRRRHTSATSTTTEGNGRRSPCTHTLH